MVSGEIAVVGASREDEKASDAGAAYVFGPEFTNTASAVSADTATVTVDEGQTAENTGTVSDDDGDTVALSASVGSVTNNNDGTWSWSFDNSDGPAEGDTVTIDADDGNGGIDSVEFELVVNNVAPSVDSVTVPADPVDINDQPLSASATFSDPADTADETYTCTVDYDDGAGSQEGTVSGTTCTGPDQTYADPGVYRVTVEVTDKDGDSGDAGATSSSWSTTPPAASSPAEAG